VGRVLQHLELSSTPLHTLHTPTTLPSPQGSSSDPRLFQDSTSCLSALDDNQHYITLHYITLPFFRSAKPCFCQNSIKPVLAPTDRHQTDTELPFHSLHLQPSHYPPRCDVPDLLNESTSSPFDTSSTAPSAFEAFLPTSSSPDSAGLVATQACYRPVCLGSLPHAYDWIQQPLR